MNLQMMHPADQIVTIMNRLYYNGMTTTSGGNLSIRDVEGNVWISPSGVDKGTLTKDDIMQIKPDGTVVGIHKPSVEAPIHCSIYKSRPDVRAILHAHPPALVAFSLIRRNPPTTFVANIRAIIGEVSMAPYACPGSSELATNIRLEFEKGFSTVMMENHGVIIGRESLFACYKAFETIDYCARVALNANALGKSASLLSDEAISAYEARKIPQLDTFVPTAYTAKELENRAKMCALIKRAYGNELFVSTLGTYSFRVDEDTFVITPEGKDNLYLEAEDLVAIRGGQCEEGKTPSAAYALHAAIYAKHPDVQAITVAQPSNIMAFAVTDAPFHALLIPESYLMLREVEKLPYGMSLGNPSAVAEKVSLDHVPVIMESNSCVITLGSDLLNAFDRLEVMDYSAKSVIQTKLLGGRVIAITDEEVDIIREAFHIS